MLGDGLSSEQLGELLEHFGSLRDAAIWALESGPYADELSKQGVQFRRQPDGSDEFYSPPDRDELVSKLTWESYRRAESSSRNDDSSAALDDDHPGEPAKLTRGAKSRWRRADLEQIFVKQPHVSARELAESGDLVEEIWHRRISEVRSRGDVYAENGRLALPPGTTADGGWVTLPKRG